MINILFEILLAGVPAVLAITLHEAAHGYAALAMGDDTARAAGRLSLNPLRHIDRFGTIILPAFLVIGQLLAFGHIMFLFGWAKPVPVAAWKFRDPRRGMAVVAAAGPAMNFLLAWLGAVGLYLPGALPGLGASVLGSVFTYFILFNLVLGLFNLLPIPPLDGGRIVVGVLPAPLALRYARIERFGILIVLVIFFLLPAISQRMGFAFDPVRTVLGRVLPAAGKLVLFLAGHHV
ncbi:MAG: site-2 protease family protein [Rhodospirillales bacterium]|nr:site-2 protease family protein [Rhodospirillales bacterium]